MRAHVREGFRHAPLAEFTKKILAPVCKTYGRSPYISTMFNTLILTTMTTRHDAIDSTAARALLMADYRISRFGEEQSKRVWVKLNKGFYFRTTKNDLPLDRPKLRYFKSVIAAAHALDTIQQIYNPEDFGCYWEDARRDDRRAAREAWEISPLG